MISTIARRGPWQHLSPAGIFPRTTIISLPNTPSLASMFTEKIRLTTDATSTHAGRTGGFESHSLTSAESVSVARGGYVVTRPNQPSQRSSSSIPTTLVNPSQGPSQSDSTPTANVADEVAKDTRRSAKLYWQLSKGRLSTWVALSPLPCFMGLSAAVDPLCLLGLVTGTFLCSASAAAMNQVLEYHLDAKMGRTRLRPLATGRLKMSEGLWYVATTGTAGTLVLGLACNPLTAALGVGTIVAYNAVYTPLKVLSPYNTHAGSIIGAVPTIMGATAATGAVLSGSPLPFLIFGIQVLWQFPHFYTLAWLHRKDYSSVGFRMFPLNDDTGRKTATMMYPYMLTLLLLPLVSENVAKCRKKEIWA
eukprot:Selendium_serpulae@DN5170_c0_g1_i1.p1